MKKVLLIGASGLTGRLCLEELLKDDYFTEVEIWVRKSLEISNPKLIEKIINFSEIGEMSAVDSDYIFCCLGTTIKKAKTKKAFRKVDFEYVTQLAKLVERAGAENFIVISSIGANAGSGNFYLRTKGEMEQFVKECKIPAIYLLRPSFLIGKRNEVRVGEKIAMNIFSALGFFMIGKFKKYRGIDALIVAKAMIILSKKRESGVHFVESDQILEIGK